MLSRSSTGRILHATVLTRLLCQGLLLVVLLLVHCRDLLLMLLLLVLMLAVEVGRIDLQVSEILLQLQLLLLHTLLMRILLELIVVSWAGEVMLVMLMVMHHLMRWHRCRLRPLRISSINGPCCCAILMMEHKVSRRSLLW